MLQPVVAFMIPLLQDKAASADVPINNQLSSSSTAPIKIWRLNVTRLLHIPLKLC